MPPKKQDKKAPAQAEEDLSDLSSLPPLKLFTTTTLYSFYLEKSKNDVKTALEELLSEEQVSNNESLSHIKTISRQSILESIQEKRGEVPEGEEPKPVTSQDLAQAFTQRIVELGIPLRREKKGSEVPANDAEGENTQNEGETPDPKAEMTINLIDYPLNQEEFSEFAKLRNPLNKVIAIMEKKPENYAELVAEANKLKPEGEGEPPAEEEPEPEKLISEEERQKIEKLIRAYDYKAFYSSPHSVLKLSDLAVVPYEHVVQEPVEGEETEPRNSVNELKDRVLKEIEAGEKRVIGYLNSIAKHIKPEAPRPETAHSKKSKASEPAQEPEGEADESQPKPPPELIPAELQETVLSTACSLESEQMGLREEEEASAPSWQNFKTYAKNTTRFDYSKTTVGHLLISAIKEVSHDQPKRNVDTTFLEQKLKEGYEEIDTNHIYQEDQEEEQNTESRNKSHSGQQVLNVEQEHVQNRTPRVKVVQDQESPLFDKIDQVVVQNHLMTTLDGAECGVLERKVLENLVLPGAKRHGMPQNPDKSLPQRRAEINEISSFSSIGREQISRMLVLKELEAMMKRSEPERTWDFTNRAFLRNYTPSALKYALSQFLQLGPDMATHYYPREDGLLLCLYFKNPPGRIIRSQGSFSFPTSSPKNTFRQFVAGEDDEYIDLGGSDEIRYFNQKDAVKWNLKTMCPSDNSIIKTVKCEIGNKVIGRSTIIKDNFVFGIRDTTSKTPENYFSREEREVMTSGSEIWANLGENGVKFLAENVEDSREEFSGAAATFTYKDGLVVKFLPSMEVLQTRTEGQRKFNQKVVDLAHDVPDDAKIELRRVITKSGTVIRYMKNGSTQLLFANGNFSVYDPKTKNWTKTKNSGERQVHKIDPETQKVIQITDLDPVEVHHKIDPETNDNIETRSDGVMTIYYSSGAKLVLHHDNTQILTNKNEDRTDVTVEKDGFAPVKIRFNAQKFQAQSVIGMGGTNALMGIDDIMERTHDGYVIETHLPDQLVESYREKQTLEGYNNFSHNTIHLARRKDFSVIKVKQDGEVILITSNQRAYLNDIGYHCDLGKDKDYFFELYGLEKDRRSGVYTGNLSEGTIKTCDDELNVFIVYANGESIEKLSVTFNLDETADSLARKKPSSPRNLPNGEYIEEECKFLVPPKSVMEPRLLFIRNDESGYEFLNRKQLEYFFRVREVDQISINETKMSKIGTEDVRLITSLTPNKPVELKVTEHNIQAPIQTVQIPKNPAQEQFLTDKLVEFEEFNETDVDKFEDSMQRYHGYKREQEEISKSLEVDEKTLPFRSKEKLLEEQKFFELIANMKKRGD